MRTNNDGEWNSPAMVFAMLFAIVAVVAAGAMIDVSAARKSYCEAVGDDPQAMNKREAMHWESWCQ